MSDDNSPRIRLDPGDVAQSLQQLAVLYQVPADTLALIGQVIALYPRPAQMYINEAQAALFSENHAQLMDLFTFDMETDELICYSRAPNTLIDGIIEMAMYLAGFSTMMGNTDTWVVEFTIGAWKHVKKRIKRQLDIPVDDHPTGIVGLPPDSEDGMENPSYRFRTLVSQFTQNAFYQMVVLAARDNITIYFPPDTDHKVMATYVYSRRAMEEIAQGIRLDDPVTFNARLVDAIRRIDHLFKPASLPQAAESPPPSNDLPADSPFTAFIEELFADDDNENS